MIHTEVLVKQTKDAYNWADKLIDSIPSDKWNEIPPVVQTSVSWQIGHLIVSFYYHTIMVISGHQNEILKTIPLKEYSELFTNNSPEAASGKIDSVTLRSHLTYMANKSIENISMLPPDSLNASLEPVLPKHPIADNKYEAIDWNIKHTMYHCGQLGLLKRIIHERYNFRAKTDS